MDRELHSIVENPTEEDLMAACALVVAHDGELDQERIDQALALMAADPESHRLGYALAMSSRQAGANQTALDATTDGHDHGERATPYPYASSDGDDTIPLDESNEMPEEPYLMSGGVHPKDQIRQRRDSNDATVCKDDFYAMLRHMPFKMLSRKDLVNWELFDEPASINRIDDNWQTTVLGVEKAIDDQQELLDMGGTFTDETMLGSLACRGGYVQKQKAVHYPEDIECPVPVEDEDHYDREYWDAIKAQGQVWNELRICRDTDDEGRPRG